MNGECCGRRGRSSKCSPGTKRQIGRETERERVREREREKSRKRVGSSFATRFSSLGWSLLFALSVLEPQTAAANGANLRQLEARG